MKQPATKNLAFSTDRAFKTKRRDHRAAGMSQEEMQRALERVAAAEKKMREKVSQETARMPTTSFDECVAKMTVGAFFHLKIFSKGRRDELFWAHTSKDSSNPAYRRALHDKATQQDVLGRMVDAGIVRVIGNRQERQWEVKSIDQIDAAIDDYRAGGSLIRQLASGTAADKMMVPTKSAAIELLDRIESGELTPPFTARDVCRHHWSGLRETTVVDSALSVLVHQGVLHTVTVKTDGRPREEFHWVDPPEDEAPQSSSDSAPTPEEILNELTGHLGTIAEHLKKIKSLSERVEMELGAVDKLDERLNGFQQVLLEQAARFEAASDRIEIATEGLVVAARTSQQAQLQLMVAKLAELNSRHQTAVNNMGAVERQLETANSELKSLNEAVGK